jgi:hypothetical protein
MDIKLALKIGGFISLLASQQVLANPADLIDSQDTTTIDSNTVVHDNSTNQVDVYDSSNDLGFGLNLNNGNSNTILSVEAANPPPLLPFSTGTVQIDGGVIIGKDQSYSYGRFTWLAPIKNRSLEVQKLDKYLEIQDGSQRQLNSLTTSLLPAYGPEIAPKAALCLAAQLGTPLPDYIGKPTSVSAYLNTAWEKIEKKTVEPIELGFDCEEVYRDMYRLPHSPEKIPEKIPEKTPEKTPVRALW